MIPTNTLPDFIKKLADTNPDENAYYFLHNSSWTSITWKNFYNQTLSLAHHLKKRGLQPGFHVGLMAKNSVEWEVCHIAILMNRGVLIGLDPHESPEKLDQIAKQARLNALIIEDESLIKKFSDDIQKEMCFVLCLKTSQTHEPIIDILMTQENTKNNFFNLASPQAPATIIFTSGTEGLPKGIEYSHQQIILAIEAILNAYKVPEDGWKFICWLPLSNLFQRIMNLCGLLLKGQTYIIDDPKEIMTQIPQIEPHVFIGVPYFFEKFYQNIDHHVRAKGMIIHALYHIGLLIGNKAYNLKSTHWLSSLLKLILSFFDKIIFKKIRIIFGKNLKYMISGSAPLPLWLLKDFQSMGINIFEAYGLSENIIPMSLNTPHDYVLGSVGKALQYNKIQIQNDGEIWIQSPGISTQYYYPENFNNIKTRNKLGFLETGDLGYFDSEGFLYITGRKSDLIKTSTGRRISPISIEEELKKSIFIDLAATFGDNRKSLLSLISLKKEYLNQLIEYNKTKFEWRLVQKKEQLLCDLISSVNKVFHQKPSYQKPSGIIIVFQPFSVETGELTNNLKIKRKSIYNYYKNEIDQYYRDIEILNIKSNFIQSSGKGLLWINL